MTCIEIQSVADLKVAVTEIVYHHAIHGVVHSMAVSDYKVRSVSTVKSLAEFLRERIAESGDLQAELLQGMDETDFRTSTGKLSSQMKSPLILLEPTPKIISLFREMLPQAVIVGFKLLSQVSEAELLDTAYRLLVKNHCDYVLANDATQISGDRHHGYLIDSDRNTQIYDTKQEIAEGIVEAVLKEVANP